MAEFSFSFSIRGELAKKVGGITFLCLALIFFGITISLLIENISVELYYKPVEAVVDKIDITTEERDIGDGVKVIDKYYEVYVDYEVDGVNYDNVQVNLDEPALMSLGDKVSLFYDCREPKRIRTTGSDFWAVAGFGGSGCIMLGVSVWALVSYHKNKKTESSSC